MLWTTLKSSSAYNSSSLSCFLNIYFSSCFVVFFYIFLKLKIHKINDLSFLLRNLIYTVELRSSSSHIVFYDFFSNFNIKLLFAALDIENIKKGETNIRTTLAQMELNKYNKHFENKKKIAKHKIKFKKQLLIYVISN